MSASDGIVCPLCPHACALTEGNFGVCGGRVARGGAVVADNYGRLTALALDPIEKKPLAAFHPASTILSVGSYGCNLSCPFCQNSSIARLRGDRLGQLGAPRIDTRTPNELVETALTLKKRGNIGIAYTYNEPLIGYEFVTDTAKLAHEAGLLNVIVTNGYVNEAPLVALLPHLDAANIDLKGFTQDFYHRVGAPKGLATVKRSIELAAPVIHVEVTTLISPGLNDNTEEIESLARWLAEIDPHIPLHLTRFHPSYRMLDVAPTPRATIHHLIAVAQRHLHTVLPGNL
ncbi:MAG: AmmeMemoRadiSam system radical SAM enzyme [Coriobacteriales bacterium]|jgi:pyruvate formate lyase activating enzyme|nr:AmmeMemoRadiSam system radical SAM enzyme [Coriobacteriales bacterium]